MTTTDERPSAEQRAARHYDVGSVAYLNFAGEIHQAEQAAADNAVVKLANRAGVATGHGDTLEQMCDEVIAGIRQAAAEKAREGAELNCIRELCSDCENLLTIEIEKGDSFRGGWVHRNEAGADRWCNAWRIHEMRRLRALKERHE